LAANQVYPLLDQSRRNYISHFPLSFFLQEDQQTDKNDRAEHKEIHDRNERHPDPKPLFTIGCFLEEIRIAAYVVLGDGIADNEKEKERKHA
jgi:hypothetical protein